MSFWKSLGCFILIVVSLVQTGTAYGQGIYLPWAGSVNQSMAGAGTAAPMDSITATYWNPAAMADMPNSELSVSLGALFPVLETDSSVGFGALSGTSESEPGFAALPYVGWVQKLPDPRFTFGLGIIAAAGVKTNYSASTTNPIFTPQSNTPGSPGGFGQLYTEAEYLQIIPSISYLVNSRLSIGVAPTLTLGQVVADPFLFAAPDDADGSGQPRYPSGRGTKNQWGGGMQLSFLYKATDCVNLGGSIKTPQWMKALDIFGSDELGLPRNLEAKFDLPMIVSLGVSSTAIQNTLLALDVRYIDNKNTDGWGSSGFNPDGSLAGLGWGNQFSIHTGIQRDLNDMLTLRGGYLFTSNILTDSEALLGVAAPLYYQHAASAGGSIHLTNCASVNFAYSYIFENELSGPLVTPAGPTAGSNVTTRVAAHDASLGIVVKY